MENPVEARRRQAEQNIASFEQKWLGHLLELKCEGKWTVVNGGTPHGVYNSEPEAEAAKRLLHAPVPEGPSEVVPILPPERP